MPEYKDEELEDIIEGTAALSAPANKYNRWNSAEKKMEEKSQASSKKFWQSDEDGDGEAVIEKVHRMPLRKKKFKHRDKI